MAIAFRLILLIVFVWLFTSFLLIEYIGIITGNIGFVGWVYFIMAIFAFLVYFIYFSLYYNHDDEYDIKTNANCCKNHKITNPVKNKNLNDDIVIVDVLSNVMR